MSTEKDWRKAMESGGQNRPREFEFKEAFSDADLMGSEIFLGYEIKGNPPEAMRVLSYRIEIDGRWHGNSVPISAAVGPRGAREVWNKVLQHDLLKLLARVKDDSIANKLGSPMAKGRYGGVTFVKDLPSNEKVVSELCAHRRLRLGMVCAPASGRYEIGTAKEAPYCADCDKILSKAEALVALFQRLEEIEQHLPGHPKGKVS